MSENALKHYETCWFIRAFEAAIAAEADAGNTPGLVHLSTGSEVADVLLADTLDPDRDQVTGSHRSHGIALACGAEPIDLAREILGLTGGLSKGLAGTQHLIAPEAGFLTSNGIVGGQVPLAAGAALSAKAKGQAGIGVTVFGDGAVNQGAVPETMNLAASLRLPMVFILYNNGIAQSTPAESTSGGSYVERARSFGLKAWSTDSTDYEDCSKSLMEAVEAARRMAPALVEVMVTRDHGHYYADQGYANRAGESVFEASPAMKSFADWLLKQKVSKKYLDAAQRTATEKANRILASAKGSIHA